MVGGDISAQVWQKQLLVMYVSGIPRPLWDKHLQLLVNNSRCMTALRSCPWSQTNTSCFCWEKYAFCGRFILTCTYLGKWMKNIVIGKSLRTTTTMTWRISRSKRWLRFDVTPTSSANDTLIHRHSDQFQCYFVWSDWTARYNVICHN